MVYAQGILLTEPAEDGLNSDTDDDSGTFFRWFRHRFERWWSGPSKEEEEAQGKKQKKERRKRKEKLKERYEKIVKEWLISQKPKPEEELGNQLEKIRKEKDEVLRVKEEVQREKEEW
jgi:hypothetical protein